MASLSHLRLSSAVTTWRALFTGALLSVYSLPVSSADLLAFGRACLAEEQALQQAAEQLPSSNTPRAQADYRNSPAEQLASVQAELEVLQQAMDECHEVDRNSRYCHQTRIRYNRLVDIERELTPITDNPDAGLTPAEVSNNRRLANAKYQQDYANFLARCRDSNLHYEFLNNTQAYTSVCLNQHAKHSITCTLF